MAFPALEAVLSGLEGDTQLVPNPLFFRFAPDHVACRDLLRRSQTHLWCIG